VGWLKTRPHQAIVEFVESLLRTAIRGWVAYQLGWFDAHLWAYAEEYGLETLLSEDFQHERLYGTVRALNPFI
jgi:predicted nucleic acid-binding protein